MRFIHTADLHLGMEPDRDRPWSKKRASELWDAFYGIIERCGAEKADLLIIAGDLFHRQPLLRELKEVNTGFASIPSTRVVIISGNHDYISGTSCYRSFKWSDNVCFFMSGKPESIYFEDIDTQVWGLSYFSRDVREPLLSGLKPEDASRINILAAHGGDPANMPVDWKELDRAGFDYVAMGHLHKPVDISERIMYCGSPEPLDRNETGEHGIIEGDIDRNKGKKLSVHRIVTAGRQYIRTTLDVSPEDTRGSLKKRVSELVKSLGEQNFHTILLEGEYDPEIRFDIESLYDTGNIVEIIDRTRPKLDFERLERENADNVIGMFIRKIRQTEGDDDIREKALYYGVMALTEHTGKM